MEIWVEVIRGGATLFAAGSAAAVALYVSARNLKTVTRNNTATLDAAAKNNQISIEAAAQRDRDGWVRDQTIKFAAEITAAADAFIDASNVARASFFADARKYGKAVRGGAVMEACREEILDQARGDRHPSSILQNVLDSERAVRVAIASLTFVAEQNPSAAADMLATDCHSAVQQIRFMYSAAVGEIKGHVVEGVDGSPTPAQVALSASVALDTIIQRIHHDRELLMHHTRESLGLPEIRLDGYALSIPEGLRTVG